MKKLTPVALAALLSLGMGAVHAGETVDLGDGLKFDWRLNMSYGLGVRMSNPSPVIASDGNNNFKKGALTANRLGAVWESRLSKGDSGFVLNASTFYDDVYHGRNDNKGPISTPGPVNEFTSAAKRYGGGYSRLLDTYAYTSFNMGETRATVRLGKQVVNWGESMYFANIAGAQGPSDAAKAASPGAEIKEILLPEDQISASLEVSPNLSLLAHYQFGFHETLLPAVGMYTSTANVVGPGTSCAAALPGGYCPPAYAYKGDIRPSNSGQFGIGGRYRVTQETEVGLYFLNYNDRSPSVIMGADGYRIKYFDDIKMLASTVSTTFGKFSAFGEVSYRDGTPVSNNAGVVRAKVVQGNVGGILNIGRTAFAHDVSLAAEISGARVMSVEQGNIDALTNKTRNSLVAGATLTLGYPGIFEGWDLNVPFSYNTQISGRSTVGTFGGGQGDSRVSVGATFVRKSNLSINVAYINYLGNPSVDGLRYHPMTDRDQLSVTAKYSF
ncbi:DUF1302 domain-containing protein [Comamonas sp. Y33R10-2]|uniref:DUF1302 domain-containing protein n=1 Tax=Comamonas sp. Y33R10-2 TaxID=2853257 RepID=UPI002104AEC9|nr:DUF1302 family protein [Comamonas sp. Y33R10-2]